MTDDNSLGNDKKNDEFVSGGDNGAGNTIDAAEKNLEQKTSESLTKYGSLSLTSNIQHYDIVSKTRDGIIEQLIKGEAKIKKADSLAAKALYAEKNFVAMIYNGVKGKNLTLLKNGVKKMVRMPLSLNDMLKAQYKEYVKAKEIFSDQFADAEAYLEQLCKRMKDNASNRNTYSDNQKDVEHDIRSTLNELFEIRRQKSTLKRSDEDYSSKMSELDLKEVELMSAETELKTKNIELGTMIQSLKESYDLQNIIYQEKSGRLPHAKQMIIILEARMQQADEIIQSMSNSLADVETAFDVVKKFYGMREIIQYTTEVSSVFNEDLPKMTALLSQTPLVDEKKLSSWAKTVGPLKREAERNYNLLAGPKVDEFDKMTLADCYNVLGLRFGAVEKDIKRAKHDLLQEFHPDKIPNADEEKRHAYEQRTRQINFSADTVIAFIKLADGSSGSTKNLLGS